MHACAVLISPCLMSCKAEGRTFVTMDKCISVSANYTTFDGYTEHGIPAVIESPGGLQILFSNVKSKTVGSSFKR